MVGLGIWVLAGRQATRSGELHARMAVLIFKSLQCRMEVEGAW